MVILNRMKRIYWYSCGNIWNTFLSVYISLLYLITILQNAWWQTLNRHKKIKQDWNVISNKGIYQLLKWLYIRILTFLIKIQFSRNSPYDTFYSLNSCIQGVISRRFLNELDVPYLNWPRKTTSSSKITKYANFHIILMKLSRNPQTKYLELTYET